MVLFFIIIEFYCYFLIFVTALLRSYEKNYIVALLGTVNVYQCCDYYLGFGSGYCVGSVGIVPSALN